MKPIYVHPSTKINYVNNPLQTLETQLFHKGMTLRDHFAGLAMQAHYSNQDMFRAMCLDNKNMHINDYVAKESYSIADAMLKQREL